MTTRWVGLISHRERPKQWLVTTQLIKVLRDLRFANLHTGFLSWEVKLQRRLGSLHQLTRFWASELDWSEHRRKRRLNEWMKEGMNAKAVKVRMRLTDASTRNLFASVAEALKLLWGSAEEDENNAAVLPWHGMPSHRTETWHASSFTHLPHVWCVMWSCLMSQCRIQLPCWRWALKREKKRERVRKNTDELDEISWPSESSSIFGAEFLLAA